MIAVQIADIGSFMTKFLRSEIFDSFQFMEGTLQTRITYNFDGHILTDSYSEDELRKSYLWSLVDHIWSFIYGAYVCSGTQI